MAAKIYISCHCKMQCVLLFIIVILCQNAASFKPPTTPGGDRQGRGRSGRPENVFEEIMAAVDLDTLLPNEEEPECARPKNRHCGDFFNNNFPSYDGRCNNRVNPNQGAAHRSFKRLLPAAYSNNTAGSFRRSVYGQELPSARNISNALQRKPESSAVITHMFPLWGQFLAHDIELTLEGEAPIIPCFCHGPTSTSENCINIPIEPDDIQYRSDLQRAKTCFPMERSVGVPITDTCDRRVRQQLNELSAYIDMGIIYGNSEAQQNALRDPSLSKPGELIEVIRPGDFGPLLPYTNHRRPKNHIKPAADVMFCPPFVKKPTGTPCCVSGDPRTNENSVLLSQHTIWMRLHNIIVKKLKIINKSKWDSDKLFYTAKQIVTALNQRVTYEHFLPPLLGSTTMKRFELESLKQGFYYGYDSEYNSEVANGFSTAAFRMGHTLINEFMSRLHPNWTAEHNPMRVRDSLFNVGSVAQYTGSGPNPFIRGTAIDKALSFDSTVTDDLRNFLDAPNFRPPIPNSKPIFGSDLLARNIQRGRDHGLPPYVAYRKLCGLSVPKSFYDLDGVMSTDKTLQLRDLYKAVEDIDFYAGGICERPIEGGIVGPTFACIIAYQFRDLKKGDRFWHENAPPIGPFNEEQLHAIRSISYGRILCDTATDMQSIQEWPMQPVGPHNPRKACSEYPVMNLKAFVDGYPRETVPARPQLKGTFWFTTKVDGENYNRRFSISELYQYLRRTRPNQICKQVMKSSTRRVNNVQQVRFRCLYGDITYTDFPAIPSPKYRWTDWFTCEDYNNKDCVVTDVKTGCETHYEIQAQTYFGVPAGEAKQVFNKFSAQAGLICYGRDQREGKCEKYKVRFMCKYRR